MTHILIDTQNLFFRAKHVVRSGDPEVKVGMSFHILFSSIAKLYREFNGSHVIFCLEGKSWRKEVYPPYKKNRVILNEKKSQYELEEDEMFFEAYDKLVEYVKTQTKCTVLQHSACEADDFIARWIQTHPDQKHIIISTDSDFHQLINENVTQYNGVTNQLTTIDGIFDKNNKPIVDKKTGKLKQFEDPEYILFEKCIRGDVADNIFTACPRASKKGTKNKIGIVQAFEDRHKKGFNWNNFMLQRWVDHEGVEHTVLDDYNRNKQIVDLTQQPDNIKKYMDMVIEESIQEKDVAQVGIRFMKFCGKYNLINMSERSDDFIAFFNSPYKQ